MMGDLIDVIFFNIPLEGNNIERPIKSRLKGRGMKKSVKKEAEKTGEEKSGKLMDRIERFCELAMSFEDIYMYY